MVKGLQSEWGTCSRSVSFDHIPQALACWNNIIVTGLSTGDIILLDAITGVHMSIFSSHTGMVHSLTFSLDGVFLVSGSDDNTVKLWDVQTGGVVKTLHGHTNWVLSVSISPDCTMIASGSCDFTVRLWNAQTGECCCIIGGHNNIVDSVSFSPQNSQLLISASHDKTVRWWNVDGHQIGSTYKGKHVAFSSDGTHFVSWDGPVATVLDSHSGVVVAKLQSPNYIFQCCCFSPNGKFVAGSVHYTIYIWDITGPDPYLIKTLTGHTEDVTSLKFTSSLISSSWDKSIKFWQAGASSTDLVVTSSESMLLDSAQIESVSLEAGDGIAISSDSAGIVKTWNILTGFCKASFQTPAEGNSWRDVQLIGGRLTCIWLKNEKIHVWDVEKGELLQTLDIRSPHWVLDFRISGDRSKVFLLYSNFIKALSIQTGEVIGEVRLEGEPLSKSLIVDGSRIWVFLEGSQTQGWDFGLSGTTPILLPNAPIDGPHLHFIGTKVQHISPSRIEDIVTRKEVFRLSGRYVEPEAVRWDGQYLIAGYKSGEVLILDFNHMILQ